MNWSVKMEGNGYIKLHRLIMENEFYFSEKFTKTQAWIDLLLLANHQAATIYIRGIEIKLNPGELCYSQITLANRWKWNFKTVKRFLDILSQRNMISFSGGKITTVIKLLNWSNYQKNGEQKSSIKAVSGATFEESKGEQLGEQKENKTETNKNDKNEKKNMFELFWKIYDKKVAKEKCQKKWNKISEKDKEKIFSNLPHYIAATPDKQYRKNPDTYLNNKAWEDEIPNPQSSSTTQHNFNSTNRETIPMRQLQ